VVIVAFLSLLLVAQRAARPHTAVLVRVSGTDPYRAADHTPDSHAEPGVVVYRVDAPLFFANADILRDDISASISTADPPTRWVFIDMEGVTDVDATATAMLIEAVEDAKARAIGVSMARLKGPVATYLDRVGLLDIMGHERVFLEVDEAGTGLCEAIPPDAEASDGGARPGPSPSSAGGSAS
jgi:SulP family sulfate permease